LNSDEVCRIYIPRMTDANFWHERWAKNETGFHEPKPNPLLVKNFARLALPKSPRIFVPLCGKSLDLGWLLSKGCRVAGAELSRLAIDQLFTQLKIRPAISKSGASIHYRAKNLDIFVGDIFALSPRQLGKIDAIYDRAALVALPPDVRKRYTAHLIRLTQKAPQLLISFEYDQSVMPGPPFSITNPEMIARYGKTYDLTLLASAAVPGGLKGKCAATENAWLLKPKS
jgi:thiopurine S-methyltransferase